MEGFLVQHILIEAITSEFATFEGRLIRLLNGGSVDVQEGIKYVLEVMKTPVYAQMLSPDGSTLIGAPKKIIENDLPREAHLVEGMCG